MTEFETVVSCLERAKAEIERGVAEFAPSDRITLSTAYLMGHLRAALAVCDSAITFVRQASSDKKT